MAVRELCNHLRLLSEKLAPISADDSYRVGRIWQNVRLDMPCIHDNTSKTFTDGDGYPLAYPADRGANVSGSREGKFANRVRSELPALKIIADRANSGHDNDVLTATADYFKQIETIWGDEEFLTTVDSCNGNNCAPVGSMPPQLSRYVDFRSFIAYTLLPNVDPVRWTPDRVKVFLDQLALEKANPGKHWTELAKFWNDARKRIRNGTLTFSVPPRFSRGDVKFVGDGSAPIHRSSPAPERSPARIHHVVQHLALPGWEAPKHREKKLGMVALFARSDGFQAYRPTILDNFGAYSYFFLPGCNASACGATWKLTDDLTRNSSSDHTGIPEWTAIVQNSGIECAVRMGGGYQPAFELVGLEFGLKHASLFET